MVNDHHGSLNFPGPTMQIIHIDHRISILLLFQRHYHNIFAAQVQTQVEGNCHHGKYQTSFSFCCPLASSLTYVSGFHKADHSGWISPYHWLQDQRTDGFQVTSRKFVPDSCAELESKTTTKHTHFCLKHVIDSKYAPPLQLISQ